MKKINLIISDYDRYGFNGVVAKPYEMKKLVMTLYKVIKGKEESPLKIKWKMKFSW
ncbi:MAG: hypothetical protein JSV09_03015 [Thermoplasmata archaeon]|nr:MAG: hypothetical protein JSV09_03015 [Thermoplasmata archaeon]